MRPDIEAIAARVAKQPAYWSNTIDAMTLLQYVRELEAQLASKQELLNTARDRWTEAQNRLARVEIELNSMTGQGCGIFDNLAWVKARVSRRIA
jgi:hypothetical protein